MSNNIVSLLSVYLQWLSLPSESIMSWTPATRLDTQFLFLLSLVPSLSLSLSLCLFFCLSSLTFFLSIIVSCTPATFRFLFLLSCFLSLSLSSFSLFLSLLSLTFFLSISAGHPIRDWTHWFLSPLSCSLSLFLFVSFSVFSLSLSHPLSLFAVVEPAIGEYHELNTRYEIERECRAEAESFATKVRETTFISLRLWNEIQL